MELNAEQIKEALECCVTDSCFSCPYDDEGVYSQCVPTLLDNALALITSQEQRISELEIELKAMRGAANAYKMRIVEFAEKNLNWEQAYECADSARRELSSRCDELTEEYRKLNSVTISYERFIEALTEENASLKQSIDHEHASFMEIFGQYGEKCDKLAEENERILTALANYDRQTEVRIAENYYTVEAYEELTEENERLREDCIKGANALIEEMQKNRTIKADTVRKMQERLQAYFGTYVFGYKIPLNEALKAVNQIAKEMLEDLKNERKD